MIPKLFNDDTNVKCHRFQYIPNFSDQITQSISNISTCDWNKLAFYTLNTVRYIVSKLKDKIPMQHSSNILCKICCNDYYQIYVAMTKVYLKMTEPTNKKGIVGRRIETKRRKLY